MSKVKLRQSAKLRELDTALEADGCIGLQAKADALGLSRSTTWVILSGLHKHSGLTASTLKRMLDSPRLGTGARAHILEYIADKRAGRFGSRSPGLRRFEKHLAGWSGGSSALNDGACGTG